MTANRNLDVGAETDAIALLIADHEQVRAMFIEYDQLVAAEAGDDERQALADEICEALIAHATAEEEIFYPAARAAIENDELLDEAEAEHANARDLIEQLQDMEPSDEGYDSQVKLLGEAIEHHVAEEEDELFPRVREAGLELEALGEELAICKRELLEGVIDDADATQVSSGRSS